MTWAQSYAFGDPVDCYAGDGVWLPATVVQTSRRGVLAIALRSFAPIKVYDSAAIRRRGSA